MKRLILVCGATGAGKTTHAIRLAEELKGIRFSIDPWMQTLFSADMEELDYSWMIERVERCYRQIWQVSTQILKHDGIVILDLGFTTKAQHAVFVDKAKALGINAEIHYLAASTDLRRQRVAQRNAEKDPQVYAFDVTDEMFNFMEPRFEIPDADELKYGQQIDAPTLN